MSEEIQIIVTLTFTKERGWQAEYISPIELKPSYRLAWDDSASEVFEQITSDITDELMEIEYMLNDKENDK